LAWSYRLDVFERLAAGTGPDGSFGFADKHVALPAALVLQVVTLSAAAVVGWSGWSRQPRSAIIAVTTVLLAALVLRQGLPLIADSLAGGADVVARERPYLQARASYSTRAYDAMRVAAGSAADTARLEDVVPWDETTLLRALARRRPLAGAPVGFAWQGEAGAPVAWGFEELPATGTLPRWRPIALDPRQDDPIALVERREDAAPLPPIAVLDGGGRYAVSGDAERAIAGPRLDDAVARLAAAWGLQNPRLAFGALPSPSPTLVAVRDVRERVQRLAPLLTPGRVVSPVVALDSLWWVVELYAATDRYPLSERRVFAGREVTAAQHAGVALVNAHTGRPLFVADASPSPLARAWARRLQPRARTLAQLPEPLRLALPPDRDALELQGGAAARHGSRRLDAAGYEVVLPEMGDTLAGAVPPAVWLAARGAWAATAIVVDSTRTVRALLVAPGGRDRTVRLVPVDDGTRLPLVLDAMRQVLDSLRRGRGDVRRGWARVLPRAGDVALVVPLVAVRADGATTLDAVVVADARRVGVGPTALAAAGPAATGAPRPAALTADRPLLQGLYARMRAALERGDFAAFGSAFDALGRALGAPTDGRRP
ncbi:MAG: UPF0182 family protein, partial [Gemmatimonadaceae bacterium]|nr:UPF0182 family protein [Gemmatimonadaceae bacterium]